MNRPRSLLVVAVIVAVTALACGLGAATVASGNTRHEILMRGNSFSPRALTISVGDTVIWRNVDIVRHNATRVATFSSGDLKAGETFSWVAADTGEVRYRCSIHQRMRGSLTVVAKP